MTEVLVRGSAGDDERVVIERAVAEDYAAPGGVNMNGFAQENLRVFLFAQNLAKRAGDIRGGKRAGGDLVEQRLEEVVVAAIDQGDLDRGVFQGQGGAEATEAAAEDYDSERIGHSVGWLPFVLHGDERDGPGTSLVYLMRRREWKWQD